MSLINQVLTDLNQRKSGMYFSGSSVFVGTVPTSYIHKPKRIHSFFIGVGLFVLVIAIMLWFVSKYNNPIIMNYIYDTFPKASHVKNDSYSVTLKLAPEFSQEDTKIEAQSISVVELERPLVKQKGIKNISAIRSASSTFSNHLPDVFTKEVSSHSLGDNQQVSLLLSSNVGATKNTRRLHKKYVSNQAGYTPVMVLDSSIFLKPQAVTPKLQPYKNQPINKSIRRVTNAQHADQMYQQALALNAEGDSYQASSKLKDVLQLNRSHLKARYTLAALLINANKPDEALNELTSGLEMQPDYAPFAKLYGRLMMIRGQLDDAIVVMQKARSNAQEDPEYYAQLATIYQQQKNHAEAAAYFKQALRWRSTVGAWWMGLGISLEQQQQAREAIIAYRKAEATGTLAANVVAYVQGRIQSLDKW